MVEVTTFTNVDTTVSTGGIDMEMTVEVTLADATSAEAHARVARGLSRNNLSQHLTKGMLEQDFSDTNLRVPEVERVENSL